ncbi:hypothetical protein [Bacillus sp. EB600]|uniref:hypothetical protein n=1 Tax=Bacillus sp. EB600 TaxID=2806345 RepID=UPI00210CFD32|nr:hypothetical protein [Bacillus sp. EB600]MCQ6279608.1 hypothetical protein [Bacillus sp. EB600]
MSFIKAVKDKKQLGNEKNVLHQGGEGQKAVKKCEIVLHQGDERLKAAKKCEIVLHQIEGQKVTENKGSK